MSVDRSLLRPIIVGANHRSSSLALRDAIFVVDAAQAEFLARLRDAGLSQAVALSTCDRVEVLAMHHDSAVAEAAATAINAALPRKNGTLEIFQLETSFMRTVSEKWL